MPRTNLTSIRILSTIEFAILFAFVILTWFWRWEQISIAPIDPDEVFLLGGVDRMARGMHPYIDHAEAHMPLVARLLAPAWKRMGQRPDFVVVFRVAEWIAVACVQIALGMIARRGRGLRAAAWSLALLNSLGFYLERSVQVRFDAGSSFLVLSAMAIASDRRFSNRPIPMYVAAVIMGLASASHVSGVFFVAAFVFWILASNWSRDRKYAFHGACLFGVVAVVTWLGVMSVELGGRLSEGLDALRAGFLFDGIYQNAISSDLTVFLPVILRDNLTTSAIIIVVGILAHMAVIRGKSQDGVFWLPLLLADFSILFIAIRSPDYPQRYLPIATYGCLVAALEISRFSTVLAAEPARPWRALALAGLAMLVTTNALVCIFEKPAPLPTYLKTANERPVPHLQKDYRINVENVLLWWDIDRQTLESFVPRSRRQTEAMVQFILHHSQPEEAVFTDWLNPPFRELPARHHHGVMIEIFERSEALKNDPVATEAYRRYNPFYHSAENPVESLMNLFDRTSTRIIGLDGSIGRIFRRDDKFRAWLSARYELVVEPLSETVFAVRR